MRIKLGLSVFLFFLLGWLSQPAQAATLTVTSTADSGAGSLRQAVLSATGGDIIQFDATLADSTITLTSGQILLNKNLTIEGLGAHRLTISGNNNSRIFQVDNATVIVTDMTLTDGSALNGGAIEINPNGNLTLERVRVQMSIATDVFGEGGGIRNRGMLTVRNSTINNNEAVFGAGLHHEGSLATLINVTFSQNNGTAVYADDFAVSGPAAITLILSHVTITGSAAGLSANSNTIPMSVTSINSLVVDNVTNCGFFGVTLNFINSFDTDGTCTGATQSNNINLEASLEDNGGATPTHALLAGSDALDAVAIGTYCSSAGTDQRGGERANGVGQGGSACDVGAYEATSRFVQNVGSAKFYRLHKADVQVTTVGSLSQLTAVYEASPHPNGTAGTGGSGVGTAEYWTLGNTGGGFTVNLTLPHSNVTSPQVCKYPGGLGGAGWDCAVSTATTTAVTRNGITSFSDWSVGSSVTPTAVTGLAADATTVASGQSIVWLALLLGLLSVPLVKMKAHFAKPCPSTTPVLNFCTYKTRPTASPIIAESSSMPAGLFCWATPR